MSIKQLQEEFEAVKNKMRDTGKEAFKQEVDKIFAEHPELESFGWRQYTPYFNDGDECTFRVGELNIVNGKGEDDDYEWWEENVSSGWGKDQKKGRLYEAVSKASKLLEACPEELLRMIFDNHVVVTVTRNGFDVEHYDHD